MTDIKWHQEERPKMRVNTREGVTYLTYPEFDKLPGFVHAVSTVFFCDKADIRRMCLIRGYNIVHCSGQHRCKGNKGQDDGRI